MAAFFLVPQQQTINIGFKHVADAFQGMNAHDEPTILDSNMKKLGIVIINFYQSQCDRGCDLSRLSEFFLKIKKTSPSG